MVFSADLPCYKASYEALAEQLQKEWGKENRIRIYLQRPNPDRHSLANSIRKAVGIGADLIIAYGDGAALAALRQRISIPLIFSHVEYPAGLGLVEEGGVPVVGCTGVNPAVPLITLLNTFNRIQPLRTLGIPYVSGSPHNSELRKEMERLSDQVGFENLWIELSDPDQWAQTLQALPAVDAIYLPHEPLLLQQAEIILERADTKGIPVLTRTPGLVERGALLALQADPVRQGKDLAHYAGKIVKGIPPHHLPVIGTGKVDLILNSDVADRLELHIPFAVLTAATSVLR